MAKRRADFYVENHGTIYLLFPVTKAGKEWIRENGIEATAQFFGPSVVVEHRYIANIVCGIRADGLEVR